MTAPAPDTGGAAAAAPGDPRSDDELVAAANRGDVGAFEALYLRYRDWVVRLAFRFTGNHEDALDVLQETFSYLLRKFPGFRLTARFTTFLYPAVKNLSLTQRRKRGLLVSDETLPAEPAAPADADGPGGRRSDLAEALASLPPGQREVLLLRFVDELSLEEIAVAVGIPVGTVKSRIHHALAALRRDGRARRYFDA
ncbi:MAG: RNA polymerase sigma factor [Planctomycetes bacterium]|nr:RNA polymerase sigma factor [Planctomycetota bacterium]